MRYITKNHKRAKAWIRGDTWARYKRVVHLQFKQKWKKVLHFFEKS